MQTRTILALAALFALALAAAGLTGCEGARVGAGTTPGGGYEDRGPGHGPPDHAPAHGYRAKHKYKYYPDAQVYYDTGRGVYFYYRNGGWHMSAELPSNLSVTLGDSVTLEMDTDKPYARHDEHMREYPPGQKDKGKGKGKGKKKKW